MDLILVLVVANKRTEHAPRLAAPKARCFVYLLAPKLSFFSSRRMASFSIAECLDFYIKAHLFYIIGLEEVHITNV